MMYSERPLPVLVPGCPNKFRHDLKAIPLTEVLPNNQPSVFQREIKTTSFSYF